MSSLQLLLLTFLSIIVSFATARLNRSVTYDGRSLIINGRRELLFSGSIHYTRSTPDMWPDLLYKARRGGLNVIQTYVFWNIHEPTQGEFKIEGQYDLIKFLKLVQKHGMYATLRVGPFIQAEWNHGGLPYWLREVPDIQFRSNNEPFKKHMKEFVTTVIRKMQEEKLFAPQGGPIILAQIENEYNHVQLAYDNDGNDSGKLYVQWAAKLAVSLEPTIPWIMCKQKGAPDPVINACNGRHCADTFEGPNKPYKPFLWTENWTAQYGVFGDSPSLRPAEDVALSVARFFSKNGSLVNYYMYHGGTNFGRTTAAFTTTGYYDDAPLDIYGLPRDPKWSHLRDVHKAVSLCKTPLFGGVYRYQRLNQHHHIATYEKPGTDTCAAFLTNNDTQNSQVINFRGSNYFLPPKSVSILPDCKTVVFNTKHIVSQHSSRNFKKSKKANNFNWKMFSEPIPTTKNTIPSANKKPAELYTYLKDTTDYAWYTTSVQLSPEDMPKKNGVHPILRVLSLGHSMLVYVNGEYVGSNHGSHEKKDFEFQKPVPFKVGVNPIAFLASIMGLPDSGAYMEHRYAGPKSITILGLNLGKIDITANGWGNQLGLQGEKMSIFTEAGSKNVEWKEVNGAGPSITWYKTNFKTPEGNGPVAIRMTGMKKGMVWVNGNNIGRYWMSYLTVLGSPTQSEYHIPRKFLNPKDNLLVVFEEEPTTPSGIVILNVDRDTICSYITERHPPHVNSWATKKSRFQAVVNNPAPAATLKCPNHKRIMSVDFASFGDPTGNCGEYSMGKCNDPSTKQIVEQNCIGKYTCSVPLASFGKGQEACQNNIKALAVQVRCGSQDG